MKDRSASVILAVMLLVVAGCTRPPPLVAPDGVQLTPLKSIPAVEGRALLWFTGVKGIGVRYNVDCYRLVYSAPGPDGRTVLLSGLLALPRGAMPQRLVSYQHGTTTTPANVPSKPDGQGLAAAIVFAGNGYAVIAPDYPGLGVSVSRHSYYVAEDTAHAVAAMIGTAQQLQGIPASPVFLVGFSQGGHASLATLRLLEGEGKNVLGAALVAGAYDLRHISLPVALAGGSATQSLYLAYVARSYSAYYNHPLEGFMTPEYAALVEKVFATGEPLEILKALPLEPRRMFNQEFLDAFDKNQPHWFLQAVAANSLVQLVPQAPVRFYYGSNDQDVSPNESLTAANAMQSRGARVTSVNVGAIGHDASMLAAAPKILAWLRELETADSNSK
jgi:pimeloyl-ACP methyl ester carboxylesterase